MLDYSIIHFNLIFLALREFLKCKKCNGEVEFGRKGEQGLGFQLAINCKCGAKFVNSSPKVNDKSFEINRRIVFAMRLLGVGVVGLNMFCAVMDVCKGLSINAYYAAVENVYNATQSVFDVVIEKAGKEEKENNAKAGNTVDELTVSGDGSWSKRGFTSLLGMVTLIGKYTNKVLDLVVKSRYCHACALRRNEVDTEDHDQWFELHQESCSVNHVGSAGKMEVDGVIEMFNRSEQLHRAKYINYIGDGDSKTFKGVSDAQPYGEVTIKKSECVGHVQKRMGSRLRSAKRNNKGIGGKGSGKPTDKLICDLSQYYGLAIRRHPESVDEMRKEIWATYYHKCSTNEKPMHQNCPPGPNSWCKWRRAEAEGKEDEFNHPPPLADTVQTVIQPIYESLSSRDLLERCLGGHTQNANESFNNTIWIMAPKHTFNSLKTTQIAAFIAASVFNEGFSSILKMMEVMGVKIGRIAQAYSEEHDADRVRKAEERHSFASKEGRTARRMEAVNEEALYEEVEGVLYGPGIA